MGVTEILTYAITVLMALVGFIMRRLFTKVDDIQGQLVEHRVEDARTYISREEHDKKQELLKDDIRGMISPIRLSVENIEKFLREHKK